MSEAQIAADDQTAHWFWRDVAADVREALTPEQRSSIEAAAERSAAARTPADLRFHLGKYFVRITAGKERRNPGRLKQELADNPTFARKNVPLIAILWALVFLSTLYAMAFLVNIAVWLLFS